MAARAARWGSTWHEFSGWGSAEATDILARVSLASKQAAAASCTSLQQHAAHLLLLQHVHSAASLIPASESALPSSPLCILQAHSRGRTRRCAQQPLPPGAQCAQAGTTLVAWPT